MASIDQIRASDGSGNASLATIQSSRSPGSSTIDVDTVAGVPDSFMGSMGTPHTFTDPITSEVITVISEATAVDFSGHVDGANLEIDDIAPGYVDGGSEIGDIVIIRPTTQYADNVADVLDASHEDDGTLKDNIVDTDQLAADAVTNAELADASVFPEQLVAGTGTSWPWQSWTPTLSGLFDNAKWTKTCAFRQIGATIEYRLKLVANAATPMSGAGNPIFTLPITSVDYAPNTDSAFTIGTGGCTDDSANIAVFTTADWASTTTAKLKIHGSGGAYVGVDPVTSSLPFTWASGDEITISGKYEAAI